MFLVAMSVFVACTALFMWSLYSYFSEERQSEQREETAYVAAAVEEGGKDFLQTKLPKDSANRITWIDRDGTVLFDSVAKAEDMENHADRDEVQQAMKTGEGESTRYSSTLSRKTTNYALRLDDGTILRLSGTQYTVVSLLVSQFQALVAVLVLAVGLAAFLAYRVSESIIEPINHISLENPDERDVYPELRPLVRRISGQNKQIQYQMEALRQAHKAGGGVKVRADISLSRTSIPCPSPLIMRNLLMMSLTVSSSSTCSVTNHCRKISVAKSRSSLARCTSSLIRRVTSCSWDSVSSKISRILDQFASGASMESIVTWPPRERRKS